MKMKNEWHRRFQEYNPLTWRRRRLLLGILLCHAGYVHSDIYSFRDEKGVMNFTNMPHLDKRYKLVYRIPDQNNLRPNAWTPRAPKAIDIAPLVPIIDFAARTNGLEPKLLHAVIRAESGYNANAVSS